MSVPDFWRCGAQARASGRSLRSGGWVLPESPLAEVGLRNGDQARLLPFFHRYAGGAKAESKTSWNGRESFEKAAPYPWFAKTQFTHSQRLTAVMASKKVVSTLPGHSTRPARAPATGRTTPRPPRTARTGRAPAAIRSPPPILASSLVPSKHAFLGGWSQSTNDRCTSRPPGPRPFPDRR